MTSKQTTILESAEALFEISKNLQPIDETLSQLTLFVADRVLNIQETGGVPIEEPTQPDN